MSAFSTLPSSWCKNSALVLATRSFGDLSSFALSCSFFKSAMKSSYKFHGFFFLFWFRLTLVGDPGGETTFLFRDFGSISISILGVSRFCGFVDWFSFIWGWLFAHGGWSSWFSGGVVWLSFDDLVFVFYEGNRLFHGQMTSI